LWRALRARHPGTTASQLVWLCALLAAAFVPVGLVIASDITLTDVLLQSEAWRPWFLWTGLALLTVGFAWRMPGPVRRLFRVEQRAPFSGPKALAFTLAPWVILAVASVVEPLRHALTDDGRDPLHVAAAIVALTAPPAVAAAYIAISNRRWRSRRR
jgi:hypothetical protein